MAEASQNDRIILPEKYYHSYFLELISFVQKHSNHLIGQEETIFIDRFFGLSENAQCLFIRFSNRKGPYFRADKLSYTEIDLPSAITELLKTGFATELIEGEADILPCFTKAELLTNYPELEISSAIKKENLYDCLIEHNDFQPLVTNFQLLQVELQDAVEYIKMLFFGKYKAQMTEFVVRDVGHVQLEDHSGKNFTPWFATYEEAQAVFVISQYYSAVRKALHLWPASIVHDEITEIDYTLYSQYPSSLKIADKLLIKMGQQLEREQEKELALHYFELATQPPARERYIRLLLALGRLDEATSAAEAVLVNPINATERLFATDFLNRPKIKILRSTTRKVSEEAVHLTLKSDPSIRVENLVLNHFNELGYEGLHSENFIWKNLFGLTFWEELVDDSHDSLHHPLQRISGDIYSTDFYLKRENQLQNKLHNIRTRKQWIALIQKRIKQKEGINHPLVYWYPELAYHMEKLVSLLPPSAAKLIMLEMAKNLKNNSTGFPDLFIWKDDSYQFHEVKSPNDQLSAQQLFWIDFLNNLKIPASILKIAYD